MWKVHNATRLLRILSPELVKAMNFSNRAALAGAAAATATNQTLTRGGAWVGGAVGLEFFGVGALPGVVVGGAIRAGVDWYTGLSDQAALKAANAVDGKSK